MTTEPPAEDCKKATDACDEDDELMMWINGAIGAAIYLGGGDKYKKPKSNNGPSA